MASIRHEVEVEVEIEATAKQVWDAVRGVDAVHRRLVDAMRISPDIGTHYEPPDGDVSQPSGRGAVLAGRARAFQHARLWVNDPDCLLARPGIERREAWAEHVRASGGLAVSSDPLRALDAWGLETTRRLLGPSSPEPVPGAAVEH